MNEQFEPTFVVPEKLKEKWGKLIVGEKKKIFADVFRKMFRNNISEALVDIKSDEYSKAPLEACYFPDYPDFQRDLCVAIESHKSEEK